MTTRGARYAVYIYLVVYTLCFWYHMLDEVCILSFTFSHRSTRTCQQLMYTTLKTLLEPHSRLRYNRTNAPTGRVGRDWTESGGKTL